MDLKEEKRLVDEARSDPEKFGQLFDLYYDKIFNYCVRRVGDVAIAQDVTSTTFFKAYKKLWQFKWKGVPFVAWLYRIAGNEIKSFYRSKKNNLMSLDELREVAGFEPADETDVEQECIDAQEEVERHEKFLEVKEAIDEMDEKYREVLYLRFFEEKKIAEIGEILGKKQGTVKSLVSRGLSKLRDVFVRQGVEEPKVHKGELPVGDSGLQPIYASNVIPVEDTKRIYE